MGRPEIPRSPEGGENSIHPLQLCSWEGTGSSRQLPGGKGGNKYLPREVMLGEGS